MILIRQLKIPASPSADLLPAVAKRLRIAPTEILSITIEKRSIDARKKSQIFYTYTVVVSVSSAQESKILKYAKKDPDISRYEPINFSLPTMGKVPLKHRPIIVGMGPAGLFAGLLLARAGFCPILIERGKPVEKRQRDVEDFWKNGRLDPNSNVQFGEGGAGAFSDGKLNTLTKDKTGRNAFVLRTFVEHGAPEQILWDAKPHVGTDVLSNVIASMRRELISLGGQIRYEQIFSDFTAEKEALQSIQTQSSTGESDGSSHGRVAADGEELQAEVLVLALGHSARDTFRMLYQKDIFMTAKEFAVGFRAEHPQAMIQQMQYGTDAPEFLAPAPYKVATKLKNGRGVYSFCMCPGGYVVNASSEESRLAINGMSYAARDGKNANSAIVISVGAKEYDLCDPMGAIAYQRHLEEQAYQLADGAIPQQLFGDFLKNQVTKRYGSFASCTKGAAAFANLRCLFSEEMNASFLSGMELFGSRMHGFDDADVILSGVESRTSSPIRIHRDESLQCNIRGIYPCGEGAGYAGGITSAAMDGMRVAEEIIKTYQVAYE